MLKMPWTLNDYPSSFKNFEKAKKKKAIDISNALIEEGYRENQAIPIAIEQAKEWYDNANEDDRESYLKQGEVTKHDHKYESNPELLDENELVIKQDGKWAVQSKDAKKAAKTFDLKSDAINYGKEVAQNKQTKLKVYKEDGSLQDTYDYSS